MIRTESRLRTAPSAFTTDFSEKSAWLGTRRTSPSLGVVVHPAYGKGGMDEARLRLEIAGSFLICGVLYCMDKKENTVMSTRLAPHSLYLFVVM